MKQMTLRLLVTLMMVFTCVQGWTETSPISSPDDTSGTANKINDLFSNFNQNVHTKMHALTNECMSNVSKIPSDQKLIWCQEQKQKKIDQMKQNMDRSGQQNSYWNQQLQQLQDDLDRCQYIADGMLIERCGSFEKSLNMMAQRFSAEDM
jgi:hypothetical protein